MGKPLFETGNFTLSSGKESLWRINADELSQSSWETLASLLAERLPSFGEVVSVPTGGDPLAAALRKYIVPTSRAVVIADDVVSTSASIDTVRGKFNPDGRIFYAAVAFNRCPNLSHTRGRGVPIYSVFDLTLVET